MGGDGVQARRASADDVASLLVLIQEFHAVSARAAGHDVMPALDGLLADDRFGEVWIAHTADGSPAGYAVLTWGYSLESGGRDALLDEFYVRHRRHGHGVVLLDAVLAAAGRAGARRVFLETEVGNDGARRFYARHGFLAEDSVWMQRPL
jgi:GNAT superfamily N-acetyltransferase